MTPSNPSPDTGAGTPLMAENDCTHSDERGSTVMQATDDRYECIVCGERFRLVPVAKFDPFIDGARGRVDGTFAVRSRPATDPAGLDACPYCAAWHALDHNADNAALSVADGPGPEERP